MLKRTKGRLLLTLLVITGLAGTLKDTSLSHKERKSAMTLMKDSKTAALKSIKGLSEAQLNFKSSTDHCSIKEWFETDKDILIVVCGVYCSSIQSTDQSLDAFQSPHQKHCGKEWNYHHRYAQPGTRNAASVECAAGSIYPG